MRSVLFEKRNRIGYITLNRPEALNALNDELNDALWDVWKEFNKEALRGNEWVNLPCSSP